MARDKIKRSVIFIVMALTVLFSFGLSVNAATATPSSDNFRKSGIKWYKAQSFLQAGGNFWNTYSLYYNKNPSSGFFWDQVGSQFSDSINPVSLLSTNELSTVSTLGWWNVVQDEYFQWEYNSVPASYIPSSTYVIFWFSTYIPMSKLDQVEIWLNFKTLISRTQYEDSVMTEEVIYEPFIYTVENHYDINRNWSMDSDLVPLTTNHDGWRLYRSEPVNTDCFCIGIGFRMSTSYSTTVPANYWLDSRIQISSAFVGRITDYFNGTYTPPSDDDFPEVTIPPEFNELEDLEDGAIDNVELVLNDLRVITNNVNLIQARNVVMNVFNELLNMQYMIFLAPIVIATLIMRSLLGR